MMRRANTACGPSSLLLHCVARLRPAAGLSPSHRRFVSCAAKSRTGRRRDMNTVALITPTYSHDLERCTLLCESVDRHVGAFANHYLIVPDDELKLFAKFDKGRRHVLPLSQLLPSWLKALPRFIRRNNRQYWWALRGKPVNGWHIQQFAKIAAAHMVPETASCMLDSDVVFFRPF